jgi:hypothetical protein
MRGKDSDEKRRNAQRNINMDLHNPVSPRKWQWVDIDIACVSDDVIRMKNDETHGATWTYTIVILLVATMGGYRYSMCQ